MQTISTIDEITSSVDTYIHALNEQQLNTFAAENYHSQAKMKADFVLHHANGLLSISNAAFFVLDKLTVFVDVDLSISVDLEAFRKFINMSPITFERNIDSLIEVGYLKKKDSNYFVTQKTHVLVSNEMSGATIDRYYVPTLNITNWTTFSHNLNAKEQRFLYYLLAITATTSKAAHFEAKLSAYIHNNAKTKNLQRTQIKSLQELMLILVKFEHLQLFSSAVLSEKHNFKWDSKLSVPSVPKEVTLPENFKDVHVTLKPRYKTVDNSNNLYGFEQALKACSYYEQTNLLVNKLTDELFDEQTKIELHTLFSFKRKFVQAIGENTLSTRTMLISVFNESLHEFIRANFNRLYMLSRYQFEMLNAFKDFYFLPKLASLILETIPLLINTSSLHQYDAAPKNEVFILSKQCAVTMSDFNTIVRLFAENSNALNLFDFYYELKRRVAALSPTLDHLKEGMAKLSEEFEGFATFFLVTKEKMQKRYKSDVINKDINVSYEAYETIVTYIMSKYKRYDDELVLSLVDKVNQQVRYQQYAAVATKEAVHFKNALFTKAKAFPTKVSMDILKENPVQMEFLDAATPYFEEYYKELQSSVEFVTKDAHGEIIDTTTCNINASDMEIRARSKAALGMELTKAEENYYQQYRERVNFANASEYILDIQLDEAKINQLQVQLMRQLSTLAMSYRVHPSHAHHLAPNQTEKIVSFEQFLNIDRALLLNGGFNKRTVQQVFTN